MQGDAEARGALPYQRQEAFAVGRVHEDGLAVVAALHDVVRLPGDGQARKSGHGRNRFRPA